MSSPSPAGTFTIARKISRLGTLRPTGPGTWGDPTDRTRPARNVPGGEVHPLRRGEQRQHPQRDAADAGPSPQAR